MEGLAASVAMHRCHDLWNLVLLKAAFRQPTGCLATAAFIVIGIGARRRENLAGCCAGLSRFGNRTFRKSSNGSKSKRQFSAVIGPAPLFLRPTQPSCDYGNGPLHVRKELFPFRRQLFKKPTSMATMSNQSLRAAVRSVGRLNGRTARSSGLVSRQFSTSPAHGMQLEERL